MRRTALPYLAGAGALLCWASMAAAIGSSLRAAPPETVVLWGLLIAGVALLALERAQGRKVLQWPGWRMAAFGVCGTWGYHTAIVFAFARAPILKANGLNFVWMPAVVLLGALLVRRRVTSRMLLGVLGAVVVIGSGPGPAGSQVGLAFAHHAEGYELALVAALIWSAYTVLTPVVAQTGRASLALVFLLSALAALGVLLVRGAPLLPPASALRPLAVLGVVSLALAYPLWEHAALGANGQALGLMSLLTPLVSTVLLGWVMRVTMGSALLAGLVLILAAAAIGGGGMRAPSRPTMERA